jgi:two-component system, chemotaxis family, CheB/CheR fusion protein
MATTRRSSTGSRDRQALEGVLEYLKENRGFDFTGYKRSTLERRIRRRMAEVELDSLPDYQDFLEVTPDEFTELFNTILINVTGFFRDAKAWDYLRNEIVPRLLAGKADDAPLRVWSAACSSGEEAYTAAMVLAEQLGEDAFRKRVKIYATDIDDDALAQARQALFSKQAIKGVPADLVEKYFRRNGLGYAFRPDLRGSVVFGRNDLVRDAPISRIDLLVSRNALMYFTREAQARILAHFNFALNDDGFLFLGKSEMLISHRDLFTPVEVKFRVFRKVPAHGLRDRLPALAETVGMPIEYLPGGASDLSERAVEVAPLPQVVVDRDGYVISVNERARSLFDLDSTDIGRPFHDLELSFRPLDLRTALEKAYAERRPVALGRAEWFPRGGGDGTATTLLVNVTPVSDLADTVLGASITLEDVSELEQLDARNRQAQVQLESAYEELQSTVEELETTNEELQSTNEELETTNEELQSTNEELETMNEELQSTNEELETMNDEQRLRARELDRVNLFLEGILGNLGVGVIVIDRDQRIQVWNASSHDLWGLGAEEVEGKHFLSIDIGLPLDEVRDQVRAALADSPQSTEVTVEAVNRRGRTFNCFVRTLPMIGADGENHGAILLVGEAEPAGARPVS